MQSTQTTQTQPIKFRKYRAEHTCHCNAYSFPHRAGSGKCTDPGEKPDACGDCQHSVSMSDPYGTGDRWYSVTDCMAPCGCPWSKN